MTDKLYKIRTPTGKVKCGEDSWFVFSLPINSLDSWQSPKQHTFLEAVNDTPTHVLNDGTKLYGKSYILTVPIDNYLFLQSVSFLPIRFLQDDIND